MWKPFDSYNYLSDFVKEAKYLILSGICIEHKIYKVTIDAICCDMLARSYVLKLKSHTGYNSCPRCEIEGERIMNRTVFPYCKPQNRPPKRTLDGYKDKLTNDHHLPNTDISILIELPRFDIINSFSLDYMHILCLGLTKKLIFLWIKWSIKDSFAFLKSWRVVKFSC